MLNKLIGLLIAITLLSSCKKEDIVSECDLQIPIIAVHGFFASGDSYEALFGRLQANGYCSEKLYALDWNSVLGAQQIDFLDAYIDKVLEENNVTQVYLLGHSLGSELSYNAMKRPRIAAKVKKYVHLAGFPKDEPAGKGSVPTLNIFSDADFVVEGDTMPLAENINYIDLDHFEVATSPESFENIYNFFFDESPSTTDYEVKATVQVSGKALSIVENWVTVGASVKIYEVDPATGFRLNEEPEVSTFSDENGFWGPVSLRGDKYYEFEVSTGQPRDVPIHYYREPITYDNTMVYLRTYPRPNYLTAPIFNQIPRDDDFGVSVIFNITQYITIGRDVLTINGNELIKADGTSTLTRDYVAILLYDGNSNQQSDLNTLGLVGDNVIDGLDMYLPLEEVSTVKHELNDRVLNVKNWKSESEGISVAIF